MCPISVRVVRIGIMARVLRNNAPISASAAEAMTLRMIFTSQWRGPLRGDGVLLEPRNKYPPDRLRDDGADR